MFDLATRGFDGGPLGEYIDHPLVKEIVYTPQYNSRYNAILKAKEEELEKAYKNKRWNTYLMIHERPWRMWAFKKINMEMSPSDYWKNLACIWSDTENMWQFKKDWRNFLMAKIPDRHLMMSQFEQDKLDSLPEKVIIYRGYAVRGDKEGFSYSLSRETAKWFSGRLTQENERTKIIELIVHKSEIIAYLNGRNEEEIIYIPPNQRTDPPEPDEENDVDEY